MSILYEIAYSSRVICISLSAISVTDSLNSLFIELKNCIVIFFRFMMTKEQRFNIEKKKKNGFRKYYWK